MKYSTDAVRQDEYGSFRRHVLQTVRMLGADPLALDEGCTYHLDIFARPTAPEVVTLHERDDTTQRLAALEAEVLRLAKLEREVEQLKEQLARKAPSARAISMLDALIGDFKPVGLADEDDEYLAMALAPSEAE